jgi:hypothetical protein
VALKPQDVLVTLKALIWKGPWSFADLGAEIGLSTSEVHAATKRALQSELVVRHPDRKVAVVHRRNLTEFLLHGIRYAFPVERGRLTRGIPTAHAAPVLQEYFVRGDEPPPVWPDPRGKVRGQSFSPLYKSVPFAAARDDDLYDALALIDALRGGRARERKVASELLRESLAADA